MTAGRIVLAVAVTALVTRPASAQSWDAAESRDRVHAEQDRARDEAQRARDESDRSRDREQRDYERGQEALDRASWAVAVTRFQEVIDAAGARVDAALYWKAYALDRMGQRAEALTTVAELAKTYPKSRWLSDARALELQVRQRVGQPVTLDAAGDEELKLLALNALQNSDSAQSRAAPAANPAGHAVPQAEGARALRVGAELVARGAHGAGWRGPAGQPGLAAQGHRLHGRARQRGEPRPAGRGLSVHRRCRLEAPHSACLHGVRRSWARADGRHERAQRRSAAPRPSGSWA